MSSTFEDHRSGESIAVATPIDADPVSVGSVSVNRGSDLTICCGAGPLEDTLAERKLRLAPDCPAIIGRAEGHAVPYLDTAYRPTRVVPGTGQNIMHSNGHRNDICVSRGHFMLRAAARGILFVNGVPRTGGGIRAPKNGTRLVLPEPRPLSPGEEYFIESGVAILIALPNDTEVRICAE